MIFAGGPGKRPEGRNVGRKPPPVALNETDTWEGF